MRRARPKSCLLYTSFKKLDEENSGFNVSATMLYNAIYAIFYGDLLMQCLYRTCLLYTSRCV